MFSYSVAALSRGMRKTLVLTNASAAPTMTGIDKLSSKYFGLSGPVIAISAKAALAPATTARDSTRKC